MTMTHDDLVKNSNQKRYTGRNKWHNAELKIALGFKPKDKLPDVSKIGSIDGYTLMLLSKSHKALSGIRAKRGHRLLVECKKCQQWIPAGRISQHENRKDHNTNG